MAKMKSRLKVPRLAMNIPTPKANTATISTSTGSHRRAHPTGTRNQSIIPAITKPDIVKSKSPVVTAARGKTSLGKAIFLITLALLDTLGPQKLTALVKNVQGTKAA